MKCINPVNVNWVWFFEDGEVLKKKLLFGKVVDFSLPYYSLNCGSCISCQNKYSNSWAVRLSLEASLHKSMFFLTLTYSDDYLPFNSSLLKSDVQKFLKRLRKVLSKKFIKIRYFLTGEYGGLFGRPHYHLVIFGWQPSDLVYFKDSSKGVALYTSLFLENVWKKGFITVGLNMDIKALKYLSKYMSKLVDVDYDKVSPFVTQSRKPGLGLGAVADFWFDGNKLIVTKFDFSIYDTDKLYIDGNTYSIPRYFDTVAEKLGFSLINVKFDRDFYVKLFSVPVVSLRDKKSYVFDLVRNDFDTKHLFKVTLKELNSWKVFVVDKDGVYNKDAFVDLVDNYYVVSYNKWLNVV